MTAYRLGGAVQQVGYQPRRHAHCGTMRTPTGTDFSAPFIAGLGVLVVGILIADVTIVRGTCLKEGYLLSASRADINQLKNEMVACVSENEEDIFYEGRKNSWQEACRCIGEKLGQDVNASVSECNSDPTAIYALDLYAAAESASCAVEGAGVYAIASAYECVYAAMDLLDDGEEDPGEAAGEGVGRNVTSCALERGLAPSLALCLQGLFATTPTQSAQPAPGIGSLEGVVC